jgi:hypothetical protein
MRTRTAVVLLTMFLLVGCSSTPRTTMATPSSRVYHGTASVGDFMTITIDSNAQTIAYTDVSNGDIGTVPFTVNSDGTYTLSDPNGNLVAAYEVPNYAMVIQSAKTGPSLNTPALITAVESGPISLATFGGKSYNYMQFRTSSGGLEVGSVSISAQGVGSNSSFWPFGAYNQGNQNGSGSPFNTGTIDLTQAQADPSGTFLKIAEQGGSGFDYIFGTENGVFAVDSPNGAILGLKKAASKNFDPSFAGTYKAIYYQKTGASTGMNNVETGTASLGNATLVVTAGGQVTVSDAQGSTIVQATLTPLADAAYLYGSAGELQDPCYGLFTFRVTTAGIQQDVFVTFMDKSMLFASFSASVALGQMGTYDYLYGVALK